MSIGEALEQARRQAGLTLTQVSQRTRIRETIIAGIEADDYSSCGGDFYARGHIRAIARVAGIDSEPLIEEYDAARLPPDETDEFAAPPTSGRRGRWGLGGGRGPGGGSPGQSGAPGWGGPRDMPDEPDQSGRRDDGGPSAYGGAPAYGGPDQAYEPQPEPERWPGLGWLGRGHRTDQGGWDEQLRPYEPDQADEPDQEPAPGTDWAGTDPDQAAEPEQEPARGTDWDRTDPDLADEPERRTAWGQPGQGDQIDQDGWDRDEQLGHRRPDRADEPERRGGLGTWLGLGDRDSRRRRRGQMGTMWVVLAAVIGFAIYSFLFAAGHRANATGPHQSHTSLQATARRHAGHRTSAPPATPSPTATPTPTVPLRPASAAAFGIGGTGQGDNASQAGLAIDHNPASAWHTDWYASAHFGNLYQGTGLLIDIGHPVTITAARIALGGARGVGLSLRVGNSPVLAALKTATTATSAGGPVSLKLATPAQGRYVLVWLTNLPRDPAGTYQASIYNIQLTGHP